MPFDFFFSFLVELPGKLKEHITLPDKEAFVLKQQHRSYWLFTSNAANRLTTGN